MLPPVSAPWIIEWLLEVGPVDAAGVGVGPIKWREIDRWSKLSGTRLNPWQARLLRRLSLDWMQAAQAAEKPDCPAPWTENDQSQDHRALVAKKVGGLFRALAMSKR
mgnify:CR=1 FL=1